MYEQILENKKNRVEFLKGALLKFQKDEGEAIPELQKELNEVRPFFEEEKFFTREVNRNYKRIKDAFPEEENYERAIAYVRAKKVRTHNMRRIEEALGWREIAAGNFSNYRIVAKRIEPAVRKDQLIEKTNYKNTLYSLTSESGFKNVDNYFYNEMINLAKGIVASIQEKGFYDETSVEREWTNEDPSDGIVLAVRITCEKIEKRK